MIRKNLVRIDLNAIRQNYQVLRNAVPAQVDVMPVIKANAYGHGMLETAHTLSQIGATSFAVALPEEGIELRLGGIKGEILVLGAAMPRAAEAAIQYGLSQTVFTPDMVAVLDEEAARQNREALVHIKLDTGMNRIGLRNEAEAQALAQALKNALHVRVVGIYTHFADADNPEQRGEMNAFSRQQLKRFGELKAYFDPSIPAHAANSAMALLTNDVDFNRIREGISLYGYPPVETELSFCPALSWHTEVVHVKTVSAGETIGYGCTFTAEHDMRVATVAVGYGDGYHRACSNRGQMLIRGKRVPIVGRVCMDQTMVDVTHLPKCQVGDEVVLLGKQGDEVITAEELAAWADTICYEVLLAITARVPREYINGLDETQKTQ